MLFFVALGTFRIALLRFCYSLNEVITDKALLFIALKRRHTRVEEKQLRRCTAMDIFNHKGEKPSSVSNSRKAAMMQRQYL